MLITYEAFQRVALSHKRGEVGIFPLIDCTWRFLRLSSATAVSLTLYPRGNTDASGQITEESSTAVACVEKPVCYLTSSRLPAISSHTYTRLLCIAARQGGITRDVLQLAQQHSRETMATPTNPNPL